MPQITPMIRTGVVLMFCMGALSAGATGAPHSVPDHLGVDQIAIIQAVLDDARRKWHEGEVPCLSDALESATSSKVTEHRISLSRVRTPFPICGVGAKTGRHLALHQAIIEGREALISLDYVCALCGHGTDYSLRKANSSWQIVSRKQGWIS